MPTYKFQCTECDEEWTERQSLLLEGSEHVSNCPKCGKECENIALGGSGFQFAGRNMNKQLKGFPDYSHKVNQGAEEDAEEMERIHDAKSREDLKNEEKDE